MKSRFFISTYASPPSIPRISSPESESVVDDLSPTLVVTNSSTPDRNRLFYGFALYEEHDLATPIAEVNGLAPGSNGETAWKVPVVRSEEHTSELQSRGHLVCRLLLEKKKQKE